MLTEFPMLPKYLDDVIKIQKKMFIVSLSSSQSQILLSTFQWSYIPLCEFYQKPNQGHFADIAGLEWVLKKKNHFVKNVSFSCKKSYTVLFSWSMLYLCWKHFISYIPYQNIPYQFKYHADFFFLNLLKTFIQVKTTFSSITLSGRHSERH